MRAAGELQQQQEQEQEEEEEEEESSSSSSSSSSSRSTRPKLKTVFVRPPARPAGGTMCAACPAGEWSLGVVPGAALRHRQSKHGPAEDLDPSGGWW
jgi:hypothetical protein